MDTPANDKMETITCPRTEPGPCPGQVKRPKGTSSLCGLCATQIPATKEAA